MLIIFLMTISPFGEWVYSEAKDIVAQWFYLLIRLCCQNNEVDKLLLQVEPCQLHGTIVLWWWLTNSVFWTSKSTAQNPSLKKQRKLQLHPEDFIQNLGISCYQDCIFCCLQIMHQSNFSLWEQEDPLFSYNCFHMYRKQIILSGLHPNMNLFCIRSVGDKRELWLRLDGEYVM